MGRKIREGHKAVRDGHHLIRMECIHHGIGQHAAVALAANPPAVAVIITGRRSDKGNIYDGFPCLNGPYPAAVGPHDGKPLKLSPGYGFPHLPADAR